MLEKRHVDFPLETLLQEDSEKRKLMTQVQRLKHTRNVVSNQISELKKKSMETSAKIEEMKNISREIEEIDSRIKQLESSVHELMMRLPNIPGESVPVGIDENDNVETRRWREPTHFNYSALDHIDLGLKLGLIDIERAAKIAGARFYFLRGDLVRLNYALIQFALDFLKKKGFSLVQPPYMLKKEAIAGAVILSDFEDMIYKVDGEDLYLIGTAEHPLAAMHMGEVIDSSLLPLRYAGISPCFRKEAGAHGRDTKGIFRVHQFEKVEQFIFCDTQDSLKEHEEMIRNAEEFFQLLKLPYRVVILCTGNMGKVAAKTYDLEVWLPGQGKYREAVSCSNCTDYQARALNIKSRKRPHEEAHLIHTLNSTLVATERTLVAIIENYQQKDGSVVVPDVLQPYVGGTDVMRAA